VNKKGLISTIDPDAPKGLDMRDNDMILNEKLKMEALGDWELSVCMIHSDYFDSREELDEFFCKEAERVRLAQG